ncbi:Synerg-CTERM sorting domain-containing protein [Cloacibacillus porcorum]|uniref:Synerg-CTERM sorting domain-containing protein n=1 Tax=Cloacibacillus porcorum TaxID=1197717 RepID=UPI00267209E9|nr:Synerg-CTERM sorting domain-containing protein [Cloacibacillus porcorum]
MTKLRKYGIIFLVLLMALICAPMAMADVTEVTTSADLAAALKTSGDIKLAADITDAGTYVISSVNISLDLAGKELKTTKNLLFSIKGMSDSETVLTVNDSIGGGKLTGGDSGIKIHGNQAPGTDKEAISAKLILNGGTVTGKWWAVAVLGKGAQVDVNDNAVVEATEVDGYAISGNGSVNKDENNGDTVININGGEIIGGTGVDPEKNYIAAAGIYHPQYGVVNMNGGKVSGYMGMQFKSGILNMTGGTVTANGDMPSPLPSFDGATRVGAALAFIASGYKGGDMEARISGTAELSSTGKDSYAIYEATIPAEPADKTGGKLTLLNISEGTFAGIAGALSLENFANIDTTITGGTYSSDPTEYVAEGYEVVPVGDMWQVQKTQPVGPVTPVIEPIAPVLPDVSDDVKEEVKPVVGATETDTAEAAAKLDGITEDMLEIDKDEIVAVKADTVVKVVENIATLENVTSADVLPLPVFTAKVESKKTVMISFSLAGADLKAAKPEDVKVLKVLGADSGRLFKYASDITADMDEKFTIQKVDGTIFKGAIEGSETYILSIFIKDGGAFDLDEADGSVADPAAILATKTVEPHHSSSSGCNAGFAGLLLLAAVPFIYRRKR